MKKTYINPEMEIISVDTQGTIMAGSPIPVEDSYKDPANADGRGAWDDWDDEEDF